jgi:HK97 gp10 family phage protein
MTLHKDTRRLDAIVSHRTRNTDEALGAVTMLIVQHMKTHWSASSPGEPGEPPAVDTGTLTNSIEGKVHVRGRTWHVRGVEYGEFLEYGTPRMAARPFIRPAVMAVERKLKDEFKRLVR